VVIASSAPWIHHWYFFGSLFDANTVCDATSNVGQMRKKSWI